MSGRPSGLHGLRWRLAASRRLWSAEATPGMPFLAPQPIDAPHGEVDEPLSDRPLERGVVKVRGWALFPSGPTSRVDVWLGGEPLGRARVGMHRPDVKVPGTPFATTSGFELITDIADWPGSDGEAELKVVATSIDGVTHELPPKTLNVSSQTSGKAGRTASISPLPPWTPHSGGGSGRRTLVATHQLNLGGAQLYLLDLLRELLRLEAIEPTVVSAMDGELRAELEDLGVPVHISSLVPLDDLSSHIGRIEELALWASQRDFELVFVNTATAHSFPGAEVAALLGLPAVWAIHESFRPSILWSNLDRAVRQRAEAALRDTACALFEAESTRRLFEPLIDESRSRMLPYGLDLEPIDAAREATDSPNLRRELGIPRDASVVLCVGTVEPRKAQLPLAHAFSLVADSHPEARLVFVGGRDDADSDALSHYIEASGVSDRIELIPITPDVQRWYAVSDLLVSASDVESLPRTVLEAMAWELPVLATNVFGLPELIEDGVTGWLCEPRDTVALARALDRALASSRDERRKLGRRARAVVENRHSLERYGEQVADVIEQVAAESAGRTGAR